MTLAGWMVGVQLAPLFSQATPFNLKRKRKSGDLAYNDLCWRYAIIACYRVIIQRKEILLPRHVFFPHKTLCVQPL